MRWKKSPQYENMPHNEYLRTDEGRRSEDAFRQEAFRQSGGGPSQPQGGPTPFKQSMYSPGMAQPVGPSDNGTPYGAGFVLDADSKPDFMFNYEWDHLQRKRQANQRAAYDREYLAKYAPQPAEEQKPPEPFIVQRTGPGQSQYVPNPAWGAQHGMVLVGNQWFPSSLLGGGATGSMSDHFGEDFIQRLGQDSPYATGYQPAPQQYGPEQDRFFAPDGQSPPWGDGGYFY